MAVLPSVCSKEGGGQSTIPQSRSFFQSLPLCVHLCWSPWKCWSPAWFKTRAFCITKLLPHFLTVKWGEAGSPMESSLSRRFSNYTLETNQPEHCFLISRTKQWCMVWRAPGGHISVSNPARSALREPPCSRPFSTCWIKQTGFPVITGAPSMRTKPLCASTV